MALYWPATRHAFVSYDDPNYVTANPQVQSGLSWQGIKWAWSHPVSVNWHPVTVLSHMLDSQWFGLEPWGHHLHNVVLHALNAVLVFALMQQMARAQKSVVSSQGPVALSSPGSCVLGLESKDLGPQSTLQRFDAPRLTTDYGLLTTDSQSWGWRSFFVAALFAVHPLRVESVAWVAERKDLLSAFFGLLSLWAYLCYARKSVVRSQWSVAGDQGTTDHASRFTFHVSPPYLLALLCFALGLLSKPMLVTWPFIMLLLDYWPLKRMQNEECRMKKAGASSPFILRPSTFILLEKLPFFLAAAAVSVITFVVQKQGGAVSALQGLPLGVRCENALISYCRYLGKLVWPTGLAVYYPHPGEWPLWLVVPAGVFLLGTTLLFLVLRRRWPFLFMGWLWYLGMLVPVIGLVQVGGQAMADRYTYLPSLGVLILVVWGAGALTCNWRYRAAVLGVLGAAAIILCCVLTGRQLSYWKDSEALFRHALEVTANNPLAHDSLGSALSSKGQVEEAIRHYHEALRLNPVYPEAHYNLGNELVRKGKTAEAASHYQEAIRLKPQYAEAHYNLARVLAEGGRVDEAIEQLQAATRSKPDYSDAHFNLGILLAGAGQTNAALSEFQAAVRLRPGDADGHNFLGLTLARMGRTDEAVSQYREAIRLKPDYAEARNNLARALGTNP
jgi:Flp pilus assembly protein TadD